VTARVLIVDDTETIRLLLRMRLANAYYHVIEAATGEEAIRLASTESPDLVLLDVLLPGIDGFEVCRRLKESPATAHLPIVIVTALDNREDRVRGLEIGADDFLSKPFDELALLSRVASLTRMKMMVDELLLRGETSARACIGAENAIVRAKLFPESQALIVSASAESAERISTALTSEIGCRIEIARSAEQAVGLIEHTHFDAVLIDHDLGGADPLRLGSRVRSRPETRQSATLLVVQGNDTALAAKALEIGFNDYISAPIDLVELIARMRLQLRRKRYADRLRENMRNSVVEAQTDPLTGVYNRRYADLHLEAMIERCRRRASNLTVMLLDLDRFKLINDEFGHAAGDMVLSEFTRRLQLNIRSIDLVARVGGEEFMVVLPDTDPAKAAEVAERIRAATADPPFLVTDAGDTREITVSIGFAILQPAESIFELVKRADRALYASKNSGRNRATLADAA
jgi:two-component system, cell cycle response regulator